MHKDSDPDCPFSLHLVHSCNLADESPHGRLKLKNDCVCIKDEGVACLSEHYFQFVRKIFKAIGDSTRGCHAHNYTLWVDVRLQSN